MKFDGFQLGEICFDPTTRALIYKDGRPAQLRNKSKAVLGYLLEHPNQTVTKADILQGVWANTHVSDESLVQCIADIRRLVGKDARKIVETVPREGYRINVTQQPQSPSRAARVVPIAMVGTLVLAALLYWQLPRDASQEALTTDAIDASSTPPGTENTEAFLEVLRGRVSANRFDQSESLIAERHFRRAIALDPGYARAYAELGTLLAVRFENDWNVLRQADKEKALFYAEKAVSLDPDLWLAHYALGRLQSVLSNWDAAEAHLETAMSLQPDKEDARAYLGIVRNFRGDSESAVAILQQAVVSHPDPPYWYYLGLGNALFTAGEIEAAETALVHCLELSENSPYCLRYLLGVYGILGRQSDVETISQLYRSSGFTVSVSAILGLMSFHNSDSRRQLEEALRMAGLPE